MDLVLVAQTMKKGQCTLEARTARRLDSHSEAQIMDWSDCIETTSVQTHAGVVRWLTESLASEQLLQELLDVALQ